MKLSKYISKEGLVRLGLFLVLLAGAWIFDTFHQANPPQQENHADAGQDKEATASVHFFNLNAAPVQKIVLKNSFQEKLNQQVLAQLKARIAFLLKAEVQEQPHAFFSYRNLLYLRYSHSGTPDDFPLS